MTVKYPEPGIYEGVPFAEYITWPYVNNSSLTPALKSAKHYQAALTAKREVSQALRFGSLVHDGVLEGAISARYAVLPDYEHQIRKKDGTPYAKPKATKEYKQLLADFKEATAAEGKEVVTAEELERLMAISTALLTNDRAREYLEGGGHTEISVVWDDSVTGLRCKGRIDKWRPKIRRAVDLKSSRDVHEFEKSIARFSYNRQAAFYSDGLAAVGHPPNEFCFVAVESEAPHGVKAAPMDLNAIAVGRMQYRRALTTIKTARETADWPGYDNPDSWRLPPWADRSVSLTIGGESISL